jgi:hypothetical protein
MVHHAVEYIYYEYDSCIEYASLSLYFSTTFLSTARRGLNICDTFAWSSRRSWSTASSSSAPSACLAPAPWCTWATSSPPKAPQWMNSRSRWCSSGRCRNPSTPCSRSLASRATTGVSSAITGPLRHHCPTCCGKTASVGTRRPLQRSQHSSRRSRPHLSCSCPTSSRRSSSNVTLPGPVSTRCYIRAPDPSRSSAS